LRWRWFIKLLQKPVTRARAAANQCPSLTAINDTIAVSRCMLDRKPRAVTLVPFGMNDEALNHCQTLAIEN
jgi:hypothetical protein